VRSAAEVTGNVAGIGLSTVSTIGAATAEAVETTSKHIA